MATDDRVRKRGDWPAGPNPKRKKVTESKQSDMPGLEPVQLKKKKKKKKKKKQTKQTTPTSNVTAVDTSEEEKKAKSKATFKSLGLCEALQEATASLGWSKPSDIQRESLPFSLNGRDVIGLAETGSGKTGAFALPIIQALLDKPQKLFALVLAPTRELAFQISEQFDALGAGVQLHTAVIVGGRGMDMVDQAIALARKPHVIVATPGRIVDHLENTKGFNLRQLKFLVMDEADRLLNMDFEKEIDKILEVIPRERQTFLFSATMTSKVHKLQRASLRNPVKVEVSRKYQTVKGLVQQYLFIPEKFKDCYLTYVLNELAGNSMIVFASKCDTVQRLALMMRHLGFAAIPLHGKMAQPKRLGSLHKFKAGQRSVLVATEVASRGLDIPSVDVVINYDVPTNSKDYVHRVGRTARAGRTGRALTMVSQYDVELVQRIEELIQQRLKEYPTQEQEVMLLLERVTEAQRIAHLELKESTSKRRGGKGYRKKRR